MSLLHFGTVLLVLFAVCDGAKNSKQERKTDIICPVDKVIEFDKIVTTIVSFTKKQREFPDSKSKLKNYCAATKKDQLQLEAYSKTCMKGVTKNFAQVMVYSFGATIKAYCSSRNKRKQNEMISMSKCLNIGSVGKQAGQILTNYNNVLKHGAVAKPNKNRMGYACCYYFRLLNELETMLQQYCNEKQVRSVIDFVRNLFQSLIDVACLDFTDASDACDNLPSPPKETLQSIYPNSTSFIVPLLELFSNLEN